MDFTVVPWRFQLVAREPVYFPTGRAANVLRGGFGKVLRRTACDPLCPGARLCSRKLTCPYARLFEPAVQPGQGPSGLADRPRPFVFRASHLDGVTVSRDGRFFFGLNLFLQDEVAIAAITNTFEELAREGLGATRGKAELESAIAAAPVVLPVNRPSPNVGRVRIVFATPTELKSGHALASVPEFPIVFGRARDRVSTLSALYGAGPLCLDFHNMGARSQDVRMTHSAIRWVQTERRSSRTGLRHPLGGFIGEATYEGEIGEFLPVLQAAEWTGIGRQTVWGKGEIRCFPAPV